MRVFIAIDFPREIEEEILRIQKFVKKTNFNGKITERENLHLTLKFFGEISEKRIAEIKEKLGAIQFKKFDAELGEVGIFHFRKEPRIVWVKINSRGLFRLQEQIDNSLTGFFPKEKRFMSHVTIARFRHVLNRRGFEEYVKNISVRKLRFTLGEFKLKESVLERDGAVYKDLEIYKAES